MGTKEKLREILVDYYHRVDNDGNKELPTIKAISQIKALIIESLGIKKDFDHTNSDFVSNNYDALYGYNQHIAEMKSKWGK